MTKIIDRPIRRFFAFGCSFTRYFWTTWADIVAHDLEVPQYFNLGKSGGGNEFMLNRFMQVDQLYDINEHDLVVVCWTNVAREDRYLDNGWISPGNIYTQPVYNDEFVKTYYRNPENLILHDFAYIKAVRTALEHKGCQWHFLQMLPIFDIFDQWRSNIRPKNAKFNLLLEPEIKHLKPSFYEVLWNFDIKNKEREHKKKYVYDDFHPSPLEHFQYLDSVFDHEWRQPTLDKIKYLDVQYDQIFQVIEREEDTDDPSHVFDHIRNPEDLPRIF